MWVTGFGSLSDDAETALKVSVVGPGTQVGALRSTAGGI